MSDLNTVLALSLSGITVVGAAMLYKVYSATSEVEKKFYAEMARLDYVGESLRKVDDYLESLRKRQAGKASYEEAERKLAGATAGMLLNDKMKKLVPPDSGVRVFMK